MELLYVVLVQEECFVVDQRRPFRAGALKLTR